jgi:hypothetical protein
MWIKRNIYKLLMGKQISAANMEIMWRDLNNLKMAPAIPLLGTCPKEFKSSYNRDTCTLTFIAALFILARLWNQPKCPSTYKGIIKNGIDTEWNIIRTLKN